MSVLSPADRAPGHELVSCIGRLASLGPPSGLRAHVVELAAQDLALDRVLLTSIAGGLLVAESLIVAGADPPPSPPSRAVPLEYPLVELEVLRRRRAQPVDCRGGAHDGRHAFALELGWERYVVAPIALDGRVVGFLHGDRASGRRPVDDADAAALAAFATCFALVYERAVLRQRLRAQRTALRQVAAWAEERTAELGERSVTLRDGDGADEGDGARTEAGVEPGQRAIRDLLTRREIDVLELMVRGETNSGIARALVVSEGTVKFHVKNILRKMHAANRAEATSRYLRLTLDRGGGGTA